MSIIEPAQKKDKKSEKKNKTHEYDYVLSASAIDGEILVKGKTLGRWEAKKFILDQENKIIILKRKNPKKESKVYELAHYVVENQERKKDKFTFDLEPIRLGDKKLSLGSANEKFIKLIVNTILQCTYKAVQSLTNIQPQVAKNQFVEKLPTLENIESEEDEFHLKNILPDHFKLKDIINNLHDNYHDDQFEIEMEQGDFKLSRNKQNKLLVKVNLKFTKNIPEIILYNLLVKPEYVCKWNKFVTSASKVVRPISEEKALLIHEQRIYEGLFPFPREFVYLRHSRRQDDRILIFDRFVDAIDIRTHVVKGNVRYAVWKIYKTQQELRLVVSMDATNTGLSILEEDGFLTGQNLIQLIQLNNFINEHHDALMFDVALQYDPQGLQIKPYTSQRQHVDQHLLHVDQQPHLGSSPQLGSSPRNGSSPPHVGQPHVGQPHVGQPHVGQPHLGSSPQLGQSTHASQQHLEYQQNDEKKQIQPSPDEIYQNEMDEFYDCDDDFEKVNVKLHIESRKSICLELGEPHNEIESNYIQPPQDEITWTKMKMQQFNSGEYLHYYIHHKYPMEALAKQDRYQLVQLPNYLNFLFKDDWVRDDLKGGLKMINPNKIEAQKKVLKFLLKRIGVNILTGKSVMNISMPVDIFETRSTTERMSNSLAFAPQFLDSVAKKQDPVLRMQGVLSFALSFVVNFLSMEKPFNPILGETYQGWIEKCPVYAEQICHHPAITAIQMYGRGYRIDAQLEMIANINSNSVTGRNAGFVTVRFADQCIKVMLAPGLITGTAFGDRMFYFTGKTVCMDVENQIVAELVHQPDKKYCASMNIKHISMGDYLCGGIFKVTEAAVSRFLKDGYKKYQGLEKNEIREVLHKVEGRWTKDVQMDSATTILDVVNQAPSVMDHEPYPLASDANYRLDVLWWKLRDFDQAQGMKEIMEVAQRADKKLKESKKGAKHK